MSQGECLNWCKRQKGATGCEFQTDFGTCKAHLASISSASGRHKGSLCSVIVSEGLFLKTTKQRNFFKINRKV